MVAVPAVTGVTTPVEEPTVARSVLLLVHVPPATELLNVEGASRQSSVIPVVVLGAALTVTVAVL